MTTRIYPIQNWTDSNGTFSVGVIASVADSAANTYFMRGQAQPVDFVGNGVSAFPYDPALVKATTNSVTGGITLSAGSNQVTAQNTTSVTVPSWTSPSATFQVGSTGPNGKYFYYITGVIGVGAETACSAVEPSAVTTTGAQFITLTNIPVFADSRVTSRKLYRSKDATTDPADTIAKAPMLVATINDNVTTSFQDTVSDASLGAMGPFVDTTAGYFTVNGSLAANLGGTANFFGSSGPTAANLGYYNFGYGTNALKSIAGGVRNVALGGDALQYLTSGSGNTAIGIHAGAGNQIGGSNISIGYLAYQIPTNNGTGSYNISIGNSAMAFEVSGNQNVAIGYQAAGNQNGASFNTCVGYKAGANVTTGLNNVFIGCQAAGTAGSPASTGNGNVLIGYNVAVGLTGIGSHNTIVGNAAGTAVTSGYYNTILGDTAGALLTTQTGNVAIGYYANKYGTASNEFYLNNQDRTNNANEKTQSLMYGTFNATATSQTLVINAALTVGGTGTLIASNVALTNGAAANTATLTNGPIAGNPTKWIPISDNGTTRYIPAW